jgi:hypothetical protein
LDNIEGEVDAHGEEVETCVNLLWWTKVAEGGGEIDGPDYVLSLIAHVLYVSQFES